MSGFEIIGIVAVYFFAVALLTVAAVWFANWWVDTFWPNSELGGLLPIIAAAYGTPALGLIVGLIWLGVLLGQAA